MKHTLKTAALSVIVFIFSLAANLGTINTAYPQAKDPATAQEQPQKTQELIVNPQKTQESIVLPEVDKSKNKKDPAWSVIRKRDEGFTQPLDLPQLLDIALKNDPATRKAWEDTLVKRAIKGQANGAFFPEVSIGADVTRQKENSSISTNNVDALHYGPNFKITYLLLDFGGRFSSVQETSQRLIAANFSYNQAIQDLVVNVAKSYYEFYSAKSLLDAANSNEENSKADLTLTQEKFNVGIVAKLDVIDAQSNYDKAVYDLETAKGALKNAKANLAQAIGIAADTEFDVQAPGKEVPLDLTSADVTNLIEEAIEKRPDLASARADYKAKKAQVGQAFSDLMPNLSLGGSGSENQYHYYGDSHGKEHDREYQAYLSVNWDVFNGFSNLYKMRQAQVEAIQQYETLVESELLASVDVWSKYYDYNTAVKKFISSQAFYETADQSYQLTYESYKVGLKSILDLLSSQTRLSEANNKLIESRKEVFIALAELARASGCLDIELDKAKKMIERKRR